MKKCLLVLMLLALPLVEAVGADFYVINVEPKQVSPDETVLMNISLKNLGTDYAAYLRAVLDPSDTSPINAVGPMKKYLTRADAAQESRQYFGLVLQGTEILLQYQIHVDDNVSVGTYYVPLKLIWEDSRRAEKTQTIDLGITVLGSPNLVIAGVDTLPSRIYADSEFNLSIKVENIGTGKAEGVEARLSLPEEFSGEDVAFLGTLKRNSISTASYDLKISKKASSKAYKFGMELTYSDEAGVEKTVEKHFSIYVSERGEVEIQIAGVTTSPSKIYPGKDFTLSVQLENVGRQDAKSVRAEILPTKEFTGELISFIGSLKEDDLSTAIFDLSVSKKAEPRPYDVYIKIYYTDKKGEEYVGEKHFNIIVSKKPRKVLKYLLATGIIIIVAAAYLWRRRREE